MAQNEDNKETQTPGDGNSPDNGGGDKDPKDPEPTDEELEKELEILEGQHPNHAAKPRDERSELEKATYTAKSTIKRIKELGGDPSSLLGEEPAPKPPVSTQTEVDTSQFVTKKDMARAEAAKLAKSPAELKLIMWHVENRGMSVEDAHFLANKNRIRRTLSEVGRGENLIPAAAGAGAGQRPEEKADAPELPAGEKQRLLASDMVYDPAKKAYVGKKVQHRFDSASKQWVTERI